MTGQPHMTRPARGAWVASARPLSPRPNPIRPNGMRARVLAAIAAGPRSVSDIVRAARRPSDRTRGLRLAVLDALTNLRQLDLAQPSPAGWRITAAGAALLQHLERQAR